MEFLSIFEKPFLEPKLPFLTFMFLTLVTLLVGYYKSRVPSLLGKKLPPGSLGFPYLGESLSFIKALKEDKMVEWVEKRTTKFGPVFKTSLMGSKVVAITGQPGNRFVFSGGDNVISSNQPASVAKILGKRSIFEVSGSRHKLVRGALMSFLKPESLQRFVSQMDSIIKQQLFQELNGKDSIQAVKLMKTITFKVTCSLLFGLPEGKVKAELFNDFTIAMKGIWALPLQFPGTIFHKAIKARNRITKQISILIRRKKMEMEESKEKSPKDAISAFLVLRDENGEPLPEEEIIDNLVTLIFASHDTTTILLSLLIRQLARDAKVYNKVLEEQKEVLKAREESGRGTLGWSELQTMKFTWRVAQELLRMIPPVFGSFKLTNKDTLFGGFDIPKGWQIFWVTSPTHMDKNIFEEPEKFDPSRFENPSKSIPPYTYIPFGGGPRICPGAEFARIEVLLIIHHLITNYRWIEVIPNEPLTREPLPYPAMGLPIKLHSRNNL